MWEKKISEMKDEIQEIASIQEEFTPTYSHFEKKFTTQMDTDKVEYETEYERLLKNNRALKVSNTSRHKYKYIVLILPYSSFLY